MYLILINIYFMQKTCNQCNKQFSLTEKDFKFYERIGVPVPDFCPEDILRQVMSLRNERRLYKRKCDTTGEEIISAYNINVPFPVYKNDIWWGDTWDGLDFGKAFDFSKSFFDQFIEIRNKVPREGTSIFHSENCDYNSHMRVSKNCYLCSLTHKVEDCHYSYWVVDSNDLIDCSSTILSELCYDCVNCEKCFSCVFTQECNNCNDCYFSYQLKSCDHCIGCTNLYQKSYHVFNKKVTKEEYEEIKNKMLNGSYKTWNKNLQKFKEIWENTSHRFVHNLNCENVEGDSMTNCRNSFYIFQGLNCEDCYYSASLSDSKDIYNSYAIGWTASEIVYYSCVVRGCTNIVFSYYVWFSSNLYYCDSCASCHNCFGCIGLKHKKYCILNKQYTKEEYEELVPKIIEHMRKNEEWGKIPNNFSTFAYNETVANEYFPLTKEEALKRGFKWSDYIAPIPKVDKIIDSNQLPDNIKDTPDDVLNWAIKCEKTGRPFKLIPQELDFYRKHNLPIPRISPEMRMRLRDRRRNPYRLLLRNCSNCNKEIHTSYSKDYPEKVLCEECYLKEVY